MWSGRLILRPAVLALDLVSEYYLAPDWRYRVEKEWYVRDLATSRYAAEWEGKNLGS